MLFLLLLLLLIIFYLNGDKTENFKRYNNEKCNEDIQNVENININISNPEPYYNPFDYGYYFPYNNMWFNNYNY